MNTGVYMHAAGGVSKARRLGEGAVVLPGWASGVAAGLLADVAGIAAQAPFRHMTTRQGFRLSAAMTSCGTWGWVSDRRGYRYEGCDPVSNLPWPSMPEGWWELAGQAAAAAGYPAFAPDSCLVNRYVPGARMGLHVDSDEPDGESPVVSVSLGLPAVFLWGGLARTDAVVPVRLQHGDVVVWGSPARRVFHGVRPIRAASKGGKESPDRQLAPEDASRRFAAVAWPEIPDVTVHDGQPCRINLTFRHTGLGPPGA